MELTARELAFRLRMHEGDLKRKLCNYQIQPWIIYTNLRAPFAVNLNKDSLNILENLVLPKHKTAKSEFYKKAFSKLKEEVLEDEHRNEKYGFNCFWISIYT